MIQLVDLRLNAKKTTVFHMKYFHMKISMTKMYVHHSCIQSHITIKMDQCIPTADHTATARLRRTRLPPLCGRGSDFTSRWAPCVSQAEASSPRRAAPPAVPAPHASRRQPRAPTVDPSAPTRPAGDRRAALPGAASVPATVAPPWWAEDDGSDIWASKSRNERRDSCC